MSILYVIIICSAVVSALCLSYIIFEKMLGKKRIDKIIEFLVDND